MKDLLWLVSTGATLQGCSRRFIRRIRRSTALRLRCEFEQALGTFVLVVRFIDQVCHAPTELDSTLATALPGVRLKSFGTALTVVLVYGLLTYFLFWLIALIAFIPMLLSFGLFGLVINAFLLWMTDKLIDDFEIDSVRMTLLMAVLLTVGKVVLRAIL